MLHFLTAYKEKERSAFLIFMFILIPVLVIRSLDFPINVDEPLHFNHAKDVLEWYSTKGEDHACLETPLTNLKYYSQSVDNLTALISSVTPGIDEYMVRHITGALFAWLFILFTGLLAFEITGRYRTAILAGIALLLIPPVMGQYANNLKDISFGAGYVFSIRALIRVVKLLPRVPWKRMLSLAISIAFLISVRVGGLILFPYLFLFVGAWLILKNKFSIFKGEGKRDLYRLSAQLIVVLVVGYFLGLVFWPYGLTKPLSHPFESLSMMENYSILIRQIFEGEWYWSKFLPDYYLAKWLLISLPMVILIGILLYGVHILIRFRVISYSELIVIFTLLFPLVYVVIIKANLYSGWRQVYFVAGHIAVIAAIGVESVISYYAKKRVIAGSIVIIMIIASIFPVIHYLRNPGTAYIHFNVLSGGNQKAWSNYEYDYYLHGMKSAAEWIDEALAPGENTEIIASNFDVSLYFKDRSDLQVKYVHYDNRSEAAWDYGIFGINYIHPDQLKKDRWKPAGIMKMVNDGYNIPLAVVIKRDDINDFAGIQKARTGNYSEAIELLSSSIAKDPNNFLLYAYLAESLYNSGDTASCHTFVESSIEMHPWSDKINLIDARLDFDAGRYETALKKCLKILDNNSLYFNIVPLLISCYEKTGDLDMARYYQEKLLERENSISEQYK